MVQTEICLNTFNQCILKLPGCTSAQTEHNAVSSQTKCLFVLHHDIRGTVSRAVVHYIFSNPVIETGQLTASGVAQSGRPTRLIC